MKVICYTCEKNKKETLAIDGFFPFCSAECLEMYRVNDYPRKKITTKLDKFNQFLKSKKDLERCEDL